MTQCLVEIKEFKTEAKHDWTPSNGSINQSLSQSHNEQRPVEHGHSSLRQRCIDKFKVEPSRDAMEGEEHNITRENIQKMNDTAEPQESVDSCSPTTNATTMAERAAHAFMQGADSVTTLNHIRRFVDECPDALTVRSKSGTTPMELIWKHCFDELHLDSSAEADLMAYCISKYPSDTLVVRSSRLGMLLGSTVTHALASSTTLKTLHLSNLQLTREGIEGLFEQLASNISIENLLLEWTTDIDDRVCRSLQRMLQQNTTLKQLTIRTRLMTKGEASHLQTALDTAFGNNQNRSLLHLDMPLIAQYRLYLSMSLELFHSLETSNPGDWRYQIDRTNLDMHLALNRADGMLQNAEMPSKHDFCDMLEIANTSWSAQYTLLQRAPHVWSQSMQ